MMASQLNDVKRKARVKNLLKVSGHHFLGKIFRISPDLSLFSCTFSELSFAKFSELLGLVKEAIKGAGVFLTKRSIF
jgi:hypothetical protein